jgi:hypothetical protein
VNDNHDIANRRIPITPDLDFRRSVFAAHRNIFLCSKAVSIFPSPLAPSTVSDWGALARARFLFPSRVSCP